MPRLFSIQLDVKGIESYEQEDMLISLSQISNVGLCWLAQYDQHGKAVILVHEPKKIFYKKFLYEPFPIGSNLREHLHVHINAEIVSGTICHKEDALHYLTWTYLFRCLQQVVNPAYYGLEDAECNTLNSHLSRLAQNTFEDLEDMGCIEVNDDSVVPLMLGSVASQHYLSYMTESLHGSNISMGTSL